MPWLMRGSRLLQVGGGGHSSPRGFVERAINDSTARHEPVPFKFLLVKNLRKQVLAGAPPRRSNRGQRNARLGGGRPHRRGHRPDVLALSVVNVGILCGLV